MRLGVSLKSVHYSIKCFANRKTELMPIVNVKVSNKDAAQCVILNGCVENDSAMTKFQLIICSNNQFCIWQGHITTVAILNYVDSIRCMYMWFSFLTRAKTLSPSVVSDYSIIFHLSLAILVNFALVRSKILSLQNESLNLISGANFTFNLFNFNVELGKFSIYKSKLILFPSTSYFIVMLTVWFTFPLLTQQHGFTARWSANKGEDRVTWAPRIQTAVMNVG